MNYGKKSRASVTAKNFLKEFIRAREKFPPMNSAHEGYAVLLEEVEEMWEEIKADNIADAREEAIQVGAMVLALIVEVLDEPV